MRRYLGAHKHKLVLSLVVLMLMCVSIQQRLFTHADEVTSNASRAEDTGPSRQMQRRVAETGLGILSAGAPEYLAFGDCVVYFGELHQHTGYSPDGCGLPLDAVRTARWRGNEFFAFSDHHNSFYFPQIGSIEKGCRIGAVDYQKWLTLLELAHGASQEGEFTAMRGYEYTREPGHLNVFNSASHAAPLDLDEFYSWLAGQPEQVFAQFNHPLPYSMGGMGDFNDFMFFPPVAHRIRLYENSWAHKFNLILPTALERGWYVSSVGYGDSHDSETAGSRHYGVLAPEMTRASLHEALMQGRTFGNTDGNLVAAIRANGAWMGQPLVSDAADLDIYAADAAGDRIIRVELIGNQGVSHHWEPMAAEFMSTISVDGIAPGDFYYVHVVDERGGHGWSGSIMRPTRRTLQATPATLSFSYADVIDAPDSLDLVIDTNDADQGSWEVSHADRWIRIEPMQGESFPATVVVTVHPSDLASGTQTGGFAVSSPSRAPIVVGVEADLDQAVETSLGLSPRELEVTVSLDQPLAEIALQVDNPARRQWRAYTNEPWLSLPLDHSTISGTVPVSIDLAGYAAGHYVGHVVMLLGRHVRVAEVRASLLPSQSVSVSFQNGDESDTDWQDTFLNMWAPTTPHGGSERLSMRSISSDGANVPLLRTSVSTIPPDSHVFSATLSVYCYYKTVANASIRVEAYEVQEPWEESSATWAAPGSFWSDAAIGDRCVNLACQSSGDTIVNSTETWYDLDVTSAVRRWVRDSESNHGIALIGDHSTNGLFMFTSSEGAGWSESYRPVLSVTYGQPPAISPTATPTRDLPMQSKTWLPLIHRLIDH